MSIIVGSPELMNQADLMTLSKHYPGWDEDAFSIPAASANIQLKKLVSYKREFSATFSS
jgi:hypothetical protein